MFNAFSSITLKFHLLADNCKNEEFHLATLRKPEMFPLSKPSCNWLYLLTTNDRDDNLKALIK